MPEQIASNKRPYHEALEAADHTENGDQVDLSALETLLAGQLTEQLLSAYDDAHNPSAGPSRARKLH